MEDVVLNVVAAVAGMAVFGWFAWATKTLVSIQLSVTGLVNRVAMLEEHWDVMNEFMDEFAPRELKRS